jgi:tetratricopeptide (TPR) repeat protein
VGEVDQQSGHLSNAEIEQYGDTVPTAGPEAEDRRDRIEAHLADCPACRQHVLTSQRARLAFLATSSVTTAPNADRPDLGRPSRGGADLSRSGLEHRGPDCPDDDALRDLAADLCPPDQATRLTQHAAQCDHCGPLLRAYTENFSDDLSKEDEAVLGKLKSASAGWQKKLARELLAGPAPAVVPSAKKPFAWRWVLAPTAVAACVAIAFAVWYSQRDTPEKVEKLLAQAYTEQRTMEMRIPYAAHANYQQQRGGESSLLNLPESYRRSGDQIVSHLKKNPDDSKWLLLSARFDVLDWHYRQALSTLERIEDEKVLDSSEILITRALALYEKAELEPDPQAYGKAVELLGKALQRDPNDPVVLFNQAIACEKILAYECASNDWEHLLKIEKDSGWSSEAQEHLKRIQEKKKTGH